MLLLTPVACLSVVQCSKPIVSLPTLQQVTSFLFGGQSIEKHYNHT